jgi:membrane protein DedA with SNARE-associated domain/membrane-associated phospholipid phosphatase
VHAVFAAFSGTHGYLALFVLVALESLGIPLPGESALLAAAALAGQGHLNIALVIATAATAAIVGDNGGYWIGRTGGLALARRHGRLVRLDEAKIERIRAFFAKHGAKTVFFGRFIALLRTWAAFFAGAGCMPYPRFMLFNALGGVIWAGLVGLLGYTFGRNLPALEHQLRWVSLVVLALVVIGGGLLWLVRRRRVSPARVRSAVSRWWAAGPPAHLARRLATRYPRAWAFAQARFARGAYLGLHLTLGLLICLGGLWLFGGVAEDVIHHDPLTRFDLRLLQFMRDHATPLGDRIFVTISLIGSPVTMAGVALAGGAYLAWRRAWVQLGGWAAAFGGAALLAEALKTVFHRPRPTGAAAFLHGASFSFPSGHTLGSLVGFGMLAYLLVVGESRTRRERTWIIVGTAMLVLAIGLSRLYLGVHYFSDVVAGFAGGSLWLAVCVTGLEVVRRRRALPELVATPVVR